jgi:serine/threonine protein kinase
MSTPKTNLPHETSESKKKGQELSQIPEEPKKKKNVRKDSSSNSSSISENEKEQKPEKKNQLILKDLIAENFVTLTMIGKGAFGQIYLSYDMRDNIEVSIKKEIKRTQKNPQLRTEAKIYQSLLNISSQDITGAKALAQDDVIGVPHFYGMGELIDSYYLIIEFLGPNLIELFNYCGYHKFTLGTVSLLALQMINRIEYIHKHYYIHRDIKPENFLIGSKEKANIIYLLDFGLSKRYKNPKNHQHIPYREGRPLTGTARYVSINTHLGIEQSRRDDLESIGYLLIFFLKGCLPWQGLKTGGDKYQRIMEKKLQIPTEILCYSLPDEIVYYLNYCKSLRFEDRPDYDYLRGLFIKILTMCNVVYGLTKEMLKFDWCFHDSYSIW